MPMGDSDMNSIIAKHTYLVYSQKMIVRNISLNLK